MLLILDGYSYYVAHAWWKIGLFGEQTDLWLLSVYSIALSSSITEISPSCAPISELPFIIRTMVDIITPATFTSTVHFPSREALKHSHMDTDSIFYRGGGAEFI